MSWGGYESLVVPVGIPLRTDSNAKNDHYLVRVHAGLEHVDDLINDFHRALHLPVNFRA
ncbi:cystathionine beta-lyase [compost metagenome]